MIGPRVGIAVGPRIGAAIGVDANELSALGGAPNPMASVTRDATSAIYCPANASEWTTTLTVAGLAGGNPAGLWLCQEASGNLADAIGANPLVVAGAPTFQNANAGWTRKSVNITATTVQAFSLGAGSFDPSSVSVAWLGYCCLTATPGGNRTVITPTNAATSIHVDHQVSNKLIIGCGASTATSVNTYTTSTIFPIAVVYNKTALTCTMYTALEALTVVFSVVIDGSKGIGAVIGSSDPSAHWAYLTAFTGAAAEQFTTAAMRTLLQTLAWTVSF